MYIYLYKIRTSPHKHRQNLGAKHNSTPQKGKKARKKKKSLEEERRYRKTCAKRGCGRSAT